MSPCSGFGEVGLPRSRLASVLHMVFQGLVRSKHLSTVYTLVGFDWKIHRTTESLEPVWNSHRGSFDHGLTHSRKRRWYGIKNWERTIGRITCVCLFLHSKFFLKCLNNILTEFWCIPSCKNASVNCPPPTVREFVLCLSFNDFVFVMPWAFQVLELTM